MAKSSASVSFSKSQFEPRGARAAAMRPYLTPRTRSALALAGLLKRERSGRFERAGDSFDVILKLDAWNFEFALIRPIR